MLHGQGFRARRGAETGGGGGQNLPKRNWSTATSANPFHVTWLFAAAEKPGTEPMTRIRN